MVARVGINDVVCENVKQVRVFAMEESKEVLILMDGHWLQAFGQVVIYVAGVASLSVKN